MPASPRTTSGKSSAARASSSAAKSPGSRRGSKLGVTLEDFRAKIEAGVALHEIAEPDRDIDGKLIPFFGAQVGWGLHRELASVADVICTECRDNPIAGGSVCMGCLKSARDGEIAALLAKEE